MTATAETPTWDVTTTEGYFEVNADSYGRSDDGALVEFRQAGRTVAFVPIQKLIHARRI